MLASIGMTSLPPAAEYEPYDPPPDTLPDLPPRAATDDLVQMNVRVPRSIRDAVDARRATKGLSRDKWVTRAMLLALRTAVRAEPVDSPSGRSAPPPRYRG